MEVYKGRQKPTFDPRRTRWPLTAALLWIATRDERQVALYGGMNVNGCEIGLSLRLAIDGLRSPDLSRAWATLQDALSDGQLTGLATRVDRERLTGVVRTTPGIRFPPTEQTGIVREMEIDRNSREERSVLNFTGGRRAHSWSEIYDPHFSREDLFALWPQFVGEQAAQPAGAPAEIPRLPEVNEAGESWRPPATDQEVAADPYRSGGPGRPTAMRFVQVEAERRRRFGLTTKVLSREADTLHEWCKAHHPGITPPTAKAIANKIRGEHSSWLSAQNY